MIRRQDEVAGYGRDSTWGRQTYFLNGTMRKFLWLSTRRAYAWAPLGSGGYLSKIIALALLLGCAGPALASQAPSDERNILTLTSGSVLLSATSEYGGQWTALNLVSGGGGWSSAQHHPLGNELLFELPQAFGLTAIVLDNSASQEKNYPGISARAVEIWGSAKSSKEGFVKLATLEAPKGARREFSLPKASPAQWLKIVIAGNWGNPDYVELSGVKVFGTPVGAAPPRPPVSGLYNTNYGLLQLAQSGTSVSGCYYSGQAHVSGASDGRTINFEWTQNNDKRSGSALMVLTADGEFLNGVWFEKGALAGTWFGSRITFRQTCSPPGADLAGNIAVSGRAILYGIHFGSDSAVLAADSRTTLDDVLTLLNRDPALKLRVEGHTDSTNTDLYNMQLSQRRAEAVVAWLTHNGVAAGRLAAEGFGKTRPTADNATPEGRALNRRVEISVMR